MAHRVQLARSVPAEPERGEQALVLPEEFPGDQGPDADHLEPVIGVGDHVGVLMENVEDGKAVRGEGADSARRLVPVEVPFSLEPLVAVSQPRRPHPDEVIGHRVLGALRAVRVDGHGPGGLADDIGRAAALQPREVEVRLVVDAPHAVCDQLAADVVVERLVGVHVGNGREGAPVVGELGRLDRQRALLQRPVGPHRPHRASGPAGLGHRDGLGQIQPGPQVADPRADGNHQLIARDGALIGFDRGHRVPGDPEPGDADAGRDPHPLGFRLRRQAAHRADVIRVAALLLVEHRRAPGRLPVLEHVEQIALTVVPPLDEHGRVADSPLLGENLRHVFGHRLRRDLQEADGMVGERVGIALPHGHRMRHQLAHRGLEVVIADGAAGDAGRPRAGSALVEHEDVLAPAEPAGPQFPGQMPGRGQAVDARADDDVAAMSAEHGTRLST